MAAREAAAGGGGGRHTAARVVAWVGLVIVGLILLLNSPPVTRLVVNKALPKLNQQLNGRLTVEGVSGSLLTNLQLRGVTLHDPEGQVVLQAERVDVGYSIWDLLHSKFTLGPLLLERPIVRLLKDHPGEQYSILRVFAGRRDSVSTASKGVDLTIRDVTLHDGAVVQLGRDEQVAVGEEDDLHGHSFPTASRRAGTSSPQATWNVRNSFNRPRLTAPTRSAAASHSRRFRGRIAVSSSAPLRSAAFQGRIRPPPRRAVSAGGRRSTPPRE